MSILLGEIIGTMVLIILGDGVVANVVLDKNKGQGGGGGGAWIVITTGWAFAVVFGVFAAQAFGSGGAHLNPAVTFGFLAAGLIPAGDVLFYLIGEFVGAFIGAVIVWLAYMDHFAATESKAGKLAVFCTAPAIRNTVPNLITEIIGTFVLVLGVGVIFQLNTPVTGIQVAGGLGPFLVGALVWGIGLSLGGPTGYAINPARDLGPRIAHFVLPVSAKGDSDWGYSWIPVVGPIIGGVLAGVFLQIL
jgi:glycerol uptake facilitator protein